MAVFGLLAASGLRIGEATGPDRGDVDLDTGVNTIREAKFGRSRLVPLHPTVTRALGRYAAEPERSRSFSRPQRMQAVGEASPVRDDLMTAWPVVASHP